MLYTEHAAAYTSDTVTICQDCLNAYTTQEINELTGTPLGTLLRVSCREPLGGCDCCVRKKHPAPAQAPCKPLDPRKIAARRERSRRAHGGNPTYVRIDSWGRPSIRAGSSSILTSRGGENSTHTPTKTATQ